MAHVRSSWPLAVVLLPLLLAIIVAAVEADTDDARVVVGRAAVDFVNRAYEQALNTAAAAAATSPAEATGDPAATVAVAAVWPAECLGTQQQTTTAVRDLLAHAVSYGQSQRTSADALQSYRCYLTAAHRLVRVAKGAGSTPPPPLDMQLGVWTGLAHWLQAYSGSSAAPDVGLTADERAAGVTVCSDAAARLSSASAAAKPKQDGAATLSARWSVLGPFPIGKTEVDAAPWTAQIAEPDFPSAVNAWHWFAWPRVNDSQTYPSELVDGGVVRWTELKASKDGQVQVAWPHVKWQQLIQGAGSQVVLEWQAHVHTELTVTRPGRFTVHCTNLFAVSVDEHVLAADQYARNSIVGVVTLTKGTHILHVRVRAKVQAQFACRVKPVPVKPDSTWVRLQPPTAVPDLLEVAHNGATSLWLFSDHLSVPLTNTADRWIARVEWRVGGARNTRIALHPQQPTNSAKQQLRHFVAPGHTTFMPLRVTLLDDGAEADGCLPPFTLTARVTWSDHITTTADDPETLESNTLTITPRCRRVPDESFVFTFVDHDGSVQHAAAVAPRRPCGAVATNTVLDTDTCPVVLSMHGTGVTANNMADAYKRMDNTRKRWVFGVDGAWTLAPTRFGAHNWEYTGSWTVTAALDALAALTSRTSDHDDGDGVPPAAGVSFLTGRVADAGRVIVAGHSMGGHGAWLWAVTHPDRVLCAAPAAGWLRKERYGDSNREFEQDVQMSYTDPHVQSVLESAIADTHADLFIEHLVGVPVLARTGQDDVTVHPLYNRRMVRLLRAANARAGVGNASSLVMLSEVPGKEHWFWDSKTTNDGGVVNDKEMRKFFKRCISQTNTQRRITPLSRFSVIALNPATMQSRGGFRILTQRRAMRLSRIDVERDHTTRLVVADRGGGVAAAVAQWRVTTHNVASFALTCMRAVVVADDDTGAPHSSIRGTRSYRRGATRLWAGIGALHGESDPSSLPAGGLLVDGYHVTYAVLLELLHAQLPNGDVPALCRGFDDTRSEMAVVSWTLCPGGAHDATFGRRHPDTTGGPIRHVYSRPWMIVVGTSSSSSSPASSTDDDDALYVRHAVLLANLHAMSYDSFVPVVRARDMLLPGTASDYNVVLIGPHALRESFAALGASVYPARTSWPALEGAPWQNGSAHAHTLFVASYPVLVLPSPPAGAPDAPAAKSIREPKLERRLALVLCGVPAAVDAAMRLALPTIPPMVRAPFTNLVPDFISLRYAEGARRAVDSDNPTLLPPRPVGLPGREIDAKGLGAVVSAGYWNAHWSSADEGSSYVLPD